MSMYEDLIKDMVFIQKKLNESREAMKNQPIVIPYENGPHQSGVRENPAFTAYEKLLKSYLSVLKQLKEAPKATDIKPIIGNSRWRKA